MLHPEPTFHCLNSGWSLSSFAPDGQTFARSACSTFHDLFEPSAPVSGCCVTEIQLIIAFNGIGAEGTLNKGYNPSVTLAGAYKKTGEAPRL
jgi:hypothetical protein